MTVTGIIHYNSSITLLRYPKSFSTPSTNNYFHSIHYAIRIIIASSLLFLFHLHSATRHLLYLLFITSTGFPSLSITASTLLLFLGYTFHSYSYSSLYSLLSFLQFTFRSHTSFSLYTSSPLLLCCLLCISNYRTHCY